MKSSKFSVGSRIFLAKIFSFIGYGIASFFLLVTLYGIFDGEDDPTSVFVIMSVIVFLFYLLGRFGGAMKKYIRRYQTYRNLIGNYRVVAIDNLARQTSQTVEFVQKDLQNMINASLFLNARVNLETNEIIFQEGIGTIESTETVEVICKSCGASNVKNKYGSDVCDYCGTKL